MNATMDNKKLTSEQLRRIQLKDRIKAVKPLLPRGWKVTFIEAFPEYDTLTELGRIQNYINLRQVDELFTQRLEQLFKKNNDAK